LLTDTIREIGIETANDSEIGRIKDFDFAIAAGGGKTIDLVKHESYKLGKPWVSFPTILSHDGIVSSRASFKRNGARISVQASEPFAIIADLGLIKKAPKRWIASGAGDLISNISAVEDWKIADRAGREKYHTLIGELALLSSKSVVAHAEDIKRMDSHGLEVLLWSLICSGFAMNIYGSSRPCSGSEHNFAHSLDMLDERVLHGEACALGTVVSTYLQNGNWQNIKAVMEKMGLPTTAQEINIGKEVLIEALVKAKSIRDRYTILNEKEITQEKAEAILRDVGII